MTYKNYYKTQKKYGFSTPLYVVGRKKGKNTKNYGKYLKHKMKMRYMTTNDVKNEKQKNKMKKKENV